MKRTSWMQMHDRFYKGDKNFTEALVIALARFI